MEFFTEKISSKQPFCYLRLNPQDLQMWDFYGQDFLALPRHLLFQAAARPHFDYFFSLVDLVSMPENAKPAAIADAKFQRQLDEVKKIETAFQDTAVQACKNLNKADLKSVLVTNRRPKNSLTIKPDYVIIVKDDNLFGNVEPVWRQMVSKLPKTFDMFYLDLGIEKFLIGPRLKLKYRLPVIDISDPLAPAETVKFSLKSFIKKLI